MFCLPISTIMYLWAIFIFPGLVCLFCCSRSWEYTNRSKIHECRNWERGRTVSFLGIHKSDFQYSIVSFILLHRFFWWNQSFFCMLLLLGQLVCIASLLPSFSLWGGFNYVYFKLILHPWTQKFQTLSGHRACMLKGNTQKHYPLPLPPNFTEPPPRVELELIIEYIVISCHIKHCHALWTHMSGALAECKLLLSDWFILIKPTSLSAYTLHYLWWSCRDCSGVPWRGEASTYSSHIPTDPAALPLTLKGQCHEFSCFRCQRHRWQIMGTILDRRLTPESCFWRKKIYLYVNSTT